jgi:hypothetical protein
VELLNIDLFNYRAMLGDADNFHGTVYRGMCISSDELLRFTKVADGPIKERYLSVPLAMVSASTDPTYALVFALEEAERNPDKHPIIWEIHVSDLDPELLDFYRSQFPTSVVTSLCAVPIHRLSDYPAEKEVLLRGPFFQVIRFGVDEALVQKRTVHRIEAVMLNSNRDHISAIASNEGADRRARDLFRAIVLLHRSTICAVRAEKNGHHEDATLYRAIASENRMMVDSYR